MKYVKKSVLQRKKKGQGLQGKCCDASFSPPVSFSVCFRHGLDSQTWCGRTRERKAFFHFHSIKKFPLVFCCFPLLF